MSDDLSFVEQKNDVLSGDIWKKGGSLEEVSQKMGETRLGFGNEDEEQRTKGEHQTYLTFLLSP